MKKYKQGVEKLTKILISLHMFTHITYIKSSQITHLVAPPTVLVGPAYCVIKSRFFARFDN